MGSSFNQTFTIGQVDLSSSVVETQKYSTEDSLFKLYLGGVGSAAELILKEVPPKINPLSPQNWLIFCTGILSGTNAPFSGRFNVVSKSPLTNTWGESNAGGRFGPELRRAGFDLLAIKGAAPSLSIIKISNNSIEIESASYLQNLDCIETENKLKKKFGLKNQVVSIGVAGEKKVLISGIITDNHRIAARSGLGAVMGSKNLKAIVVRGTKKIPIHDSDGLKELRVLVNKRLKKGINFILKPGLSLSTRFAPWLRRFRVKNYGSMSPSSMVIESYRRWGTAAGTAVSVETGDAPVKNWVGSYKDFPLKSSVRLTSDNVTKYRTRHYACHSCPMACGGIMKYEDERFNLPVTYKPEYETLAMLGSNLLNDDIGLIYQLNDYCNRQGLDTIAVGSILGCILEAHEKNLLTKNDLEGLKLEWGESLDFLEITKKIANRDGIGDILADGPEKLAEKFGLEGISIHIKNQAIPAHDPRFSKTILISYKLDAAPGRHTPFIEHMIDLAKFNEMFPSLDKENRIFDFYMYHQAISSFGVCQFGLLTGNFPALEFVNLVTGLDLTIKDIITIGERIFTVRHFFNLREGINSLNLTTPTRILDNATDGPNKNISLIDEEKKIINNFLDELKWDKKTSVPNHEHLKDLGLYELLSMT